MAAPWPIMRADLDPAGERALLSGLFDDAGLYTVSVAEGSRPPDDVSTRRPDGLFDTGFLATLDPTGSRLALTDGESIRILSLPSLDLTEQFAVAGAEPAAMSFTPTGDALVLVSADGTARVRQLGSGDAGRIFQHPAGVSSVAIAAEGKQLATGTTAGVVRVWDFESGGLDAWSRIVE